MKKLLTIIIVFLLLCGNMNNIINFDIFSFADEVFVLIVLLFSIVKLLDKKKINIRTLKNVELLSVFWLLGIISCILNSNYSIMSLIVSSFLAIKFWLLVFSFEHLGDYKDIFKQIEKAIYIVEKIAIVFALFNILMPNYYLQYFTFNENFVRFGLTSITSCFNHPSTFGWFMSLCCYFRFCDYCINKNKKTLKFMLLDIIFAVLSLRTKVILSLVIIFLLYFVFLSNESSKKRVKGFIICSVLSLVLFFVFKPIIVNTYNIYFNNNDASNVARTMLYKNSVNIGIDYFPLGAGFGKYGTYYASKNYSEYYYKYGLSSIYGMTPSDSKYSMDTYWPAIIGECGFIGFIILIIILLKTFLLLIGEYRSYKYNLYDSYILLVAIISLLQLTIESVAEASFNTNPKNILVGVIVGVSLQLINERKIENVK